MKKNRNDLLYSVWSVAILICMALGLFSLLFVACSDTGGAETTPPGGTSTIEPTLDPTEPPVQTPEPTPPPTILGLTEDMGQEYIDSIIFLGDSTTYGLKAYGMLSGGTDTTQVWTPSNGTLTLSNHSFTNILYLDTGEEISIAEAVERKKPEYLIITLGVNGVAFMDEDYFKSEYILLVETIQAASPDTKIILNTIYPVANSYAKQASINNEKVNAANQWILQIAEEMGVRFLNSAEVLKNEEGVLPEEYQNGDGLHLNPTSFTLVLEYIRTHGYQ